LIQKSLSVMKALILLVRIPEQCVSGEVCQGLVASCKLQFASYL